MTQGGCQARGQKGRLEECLGALLSPYLQIRGPWGDSQLKAPGPQGEHAGRRLQSEAPDAHFSVDSRTSPSGPKANAGHCLGPTQGSVLRIHSVLCTQLFASPSTLSSLPAEPPANTGPSLVLREPSTVRAAGIFLMLVLVASILLQAILYPWFMGTISDVKTSAQLLKGCVDNISTLGSEIKRNTGGVEVTGIQVQMVNTSLNHVHS
ncbi:C-Type Lectin Domain Family 4 Member K [Manis pentadactyla]|nr:C-Type Lectin Domain Family 4 Member K [Manis pentadactyla]